MKHRTVRLLLLLMALALLGEGRARADMVDFTYSWTVLPSPVLPGSIGTVTFATVADGPASAVLGDSTPTLIPGATITTSTSVDDLVDTFNTSMQMKLTLTDTASGLSGDLFFAGTLSGSLSSSESTLTTTFLNPLTQPLELGSHVYSVTIDPAFIALPTPGAQTQTLVDALITVSNKVTSVPPVPEPSTLMLGATAVVGLAARRCLRRRPGGKASGRSPTA